MILWRSMLTPCHLDVQTESRVWVVLLVLETARPQSLLAHLARCCPHRGNGGVWGPAAARLLYLPPPSGPGTSPLPYPPRNGLHRH